METIEITRPKKLTIEEIIKAKKALNIQNKRLIEIKRPLRSSNSFKTNNRYLNKPIIKENNGIYYIYVTSSYIKRGL